MLVQKKDKDGNVMLDSKGQPIMEEGSASPDPNELAKRLEELERTNSDMNGKLMASVERANRSEALLESYIKSGIPAGGAPGNTAIQPAGIDVSMLVSQPDKVLAQVKESAVNEAVQIMEKRYREARQMEAQSESIRQSFYKSNPDLMGWERIVGPIENEYRMRFPNTPYDKILPEIAKAARTEILDMKKKLNPGGGGTALGLENGAGGNRGGEGGNGGDNGTPQPSEQEEFDSYIKERTASRSKVLS